MILRTSPPSPFGRKVKIVAKLLGLYNELDIVNADTSDPEDSLRTQNPLGKIPCLILEDGSVLYDSRVICEYLNDQKKGPLFPQGDEKTANLTLQAMADGLTDAAVLQVYENRFRPEKLRSRDWLDYQAGKVERTLISLDERPPNISNEIYIGHISLACALGYLDLRFNGEWRDVHPHLVSWLDDFSKKVPAFQETEMKE